MLNYNIKITSWEKNKTALSNIRRKVFIEEQKVPQELEWDEFDNECTHILVTDNQNRPVATGRIKPDGHIGRMAVLNPCRQTGIGSAILKELLIIAAKKNLAKVYLHAQTSAVPFYEKHGFIVCSEEFMDAGIPHKTMHMHLK